MADVFSKSKRSEVMSRISGKNTKPELIVRRGLHQLGFRYRLHDKNLAGKPDLIFKKYRAVVFVNGCFWHGHPCHLFKWPKTREKFWKAKIESNRLRDQKVLEELRDQGWRTLTIFECALKGKTKLPMQVLFRCIVDWLEGDVTTLMIEGG